MKTTDFILIGGAIGLFLFFKNKNKENQTIINTNNIPNASPTKPPVTSQVNTFPVLQPSVDSQVATQLIVPVTMDLPNLTAGSGVPTENALQQGGVLTTLTPLIVPSPNLTIEESLQSGGIKPLVKPFKPLFPNYESDVLPQQDINNPQIVDNSNALIGLAPPENLNNSENLSSPSYYQPNFYE